MLTRQTNGKTLFGNDDKLRENWDKIEWKKHELIGPTGSTGPMKRHHEPKDFKRGYNPHVLCLVGAMCEECVRNLIKK